MSLSARFDSLPAPQYDSMPTKAGNGPKRKSKKQNPAASGPQIIRPNVSNLVMKGQGKGANAPKGQNRKRKVNPNQQYQNQRKQQKVSNYPNGNWSDYQPTVTTNRGRGFNQQQWQQSNGTNHGANGVQNGGYRSYHTQGGATRGRAQNNGPYRRPQNFKQSRTLPPAHNGYARNGFSKENRGQNVQNGNGYQFGQKRAQYMKMKQGGNARGQNGNFRGNRSGKFNRQNGRGNGKGFGNKGFAKNSQKWQSGKEATAADLDKELDRYLMKNPDAEDRTATISNHLDKELDDYFKGQRDAESNKE